MQIKAENFLTEITIRAYVDESKQPHPALATATFECKDCMHLTEIAQTKENEIHQPAVCTECDGRKFAISKDDCAFRDLQELKCLIEDRFITVYLRGCQCKPEGYKKGMYTITGRLNIDITQEPYVYYVDQVTAIRKMRK